MWFLDKDTWHAIIDTVSKASIDQHKKVEELLNQISRKHAEFDLNILSSFFDKRTTSDFQDLITRLEDLFLKSAEDHKLFSLINK